MMIMESKGSVHRHLVDIITEVAFAEKKHPKWPKDEVYAAAIVMEEAGELMRAAVQLKIDKTGSKEELRKEAIQTAAMCIRLLKNL